MVLPEAWASAHHWVPVEGKKNEKCPPLSTTISLGDKITNAATDDDAG